MKLECLRLVEFTSERMSFCGVFSRMTWRFSSNVTVAWIDLGDDNTILWKRKQIKSFKGQRTWCRNPTWMSVKWHARIRLLSTLEPSPKPAEVRRPTLQRPSSLAANTAKHVATKVSVKRKKKVEKFHLFSAREKDQKEKLFFALKLSFPLIQSQVSFVLRWKVIKVRWFISNVFTIKITPNSNFNFLVECIQILGGKLKSISLFMRSCMSILNFCHRKVWRR